MSDALDPMSLPLMSESVSEFSCSESVPELSGSVGSLIGTGWTG